MDKLIWFDPHKTDTNASLKVAMQDPISQLSC